MKQLKKTNLRYKLARMFLGFLIIVGSCLAINNVAYIITGHFLIGFPYTYTYEHITLKVDQKLPKDKTEAALKEVYERIEESEFFNKEPVTIYACNTAFNIGLVFKLRGRAEDVMGYTTKKNPKVAYVREFEFDEAKLRVALGIAGHELTHCLVHQYYLGTSLQPLSIEYDIKQMITEGYAEYIGYGAQQTNGGDPFFANSFGYSKSGHVHEDTSSFEECSVTYLEMPTFNSALYDLNKGKALISYLMEERGYSFKEIMAIENSQYEQYMYEAIEMMGFEKEDSLPTVEGRWMRFECGK